jgi:hypothetical protein
MPYFGSRDKVVDIATGYGLDGRDFDTSHLGLTDRDVEQENRFLPGTSSLRRRVVRQGKEK